MKTLPTLRFVKYHVEVEHEPGKFESDMDYMTDSAKSACSHIKNMKTKYPGKKVEIAKISETRLCSIINQKELEKIIEKENR